MPIRSLIIALALLAAIALPASAGAATVEDCQARISELATATANVTTFANEKDQAGLQDKLLNASEGLAAGKNADAIRKLTDFRTKVQVLGSTSKLNTEDAARLDAQAATAISCIEPLGA
jgi:hypothetical protein